MVSQLRNKRGITLIALVITIIVLLILAGVSISMISSQDGILNKAKDVKNKTNEAEQKDLEAINEMEDLVNEYAPNMITFTIDGKVFQAEENMMFGDWIKSSYSKGITTYNECESCKEPLVAEYGNQGYGYYGGSTEYYLYTEQKLQMNDGFGHVIDQGEVFAEGRFYELTLLKNNLEITIYKNCWD